MTDTTVLETAVVFLGTTTLGTLGLLARQVARPGVAAVRITHHQTRPDIRRGIPIPPQPSPAMRSADGTADPVPVPSAAPAAITSHVDPVTRQFVRKDGGNKLIDAIRAEVASSNGVRS